MLQLCVCRDIEHLGSLESTQEARETLTPLSWSPNFPRAQHLDIRTLRHELIVKYPIRSASLSNSYVTLSVKLRQFKAYTGITQEKGFLGHEFTFIFP